MTPTFHWLQLMGKPERVGFVLVLTLLFFGAGHLVQAQEIERKGPYSVILPDLNFDGYPDIVSTNYTSNSVTIRYNDGTGRFSDDYSLDISVGVSPTGIKDADVNLDGYLDLIVANAYSNDISVLLGLEDGTYAEPAYYPGGSGARSLLVEDFDGDGYPDVATADYSGSVTVLRGLGDGSFDVPSIYPTPGRAIHMTSADIDGDGWLDLIVTITDTGLISVLLGDAQGQFLSRYDFPTFGRYPEAHTLADFNGDGITDVIVAETGAGVISVMLGDGYTILKSPTPIRAGREPRGLVSYDLNKDGKVDLAVASIEDNKLIVLLGNGGGSFQMAATLNTEHYPRSVAAGDLDNDGNLDIVVTNEYSNSLTLIRGLGDGRFAPFERETLR